MPELVNLTPFPNFRYYSLDNRGGEFGVVIVKATYEIAPNGRLLVAEEQAPMVFSDRCHGADNVTSLWHPSDLVPHKPRTDIIVNAIARAPGGEPRRSWIAGIEVGGATPLQKRLTITGPRTWTPVWRRRLSDNETRDWRRHLQHFEGWRLSEPEPIAELPIHYEFAFGGLMQRGEDAAGAPIVDDIHENPIGCGWLDGDWSDPTRPHRAPQIEAADEPIVDPYALYRPQSLGPIPCAWEPRLPLGGTYDQHWQTSIWPNWPPDYSFAYHNAAHPDLIYRGFLEGDEPVRLIGLFADRPDFTFELPSERMSVDFVAEDGTVERRAMNLDTVFLDIAEPDWRDGRIYLSWRLSFEPDRYVRAVIRRERDARPVARPSSTQEVPA